MTSQRKVHFMCRNWQQAQDTGLGILSPCWMQVFFYRKTGWPKPLSTNDTDKVTCKHCIAALAKVVERVLDPLCCHARALPTTAQVGGPAYCRDCKATSGRDGRW